MPDISRMVRRIGTTSERGRRPVTARRVVPHSMGSSVRASHSRSPDRTVSAQELLVVSETIGIIATLVSPSAPHPLQMRRQEPVLKPLNGVPFLSAPGYLPPAPARNAKDRKSSGRGRTSGSVGGLDLKLLTRQGSRHPHDSNHRRIKGVASK